MTRAKAWYVKFPLDAYALGPVRFNGPVGETDARQWMQEFEGVKRLPQGAECWPAMEEA